MRRKGRQDVGRNSFVSVCAPAVEPDTTTAVATRDIARPSLVNPSAAMSGAEFIDDKVPAIGVEMKASPPSGGVPPPPPSEASERQYIDEYSQRDLVLYFYKHAVAMNLKEVVLDHA
eukprot:9775786-Lingulodinium_polyedra.AAC.1